MADTAITVQTLLNNSIVRSKDPNKTQWTDAVLLTYLNIGVDFIHKLLIRIQSEIVKMSIDVTLSTAQEYDLATNLPDFWGMSENGVYFSSVGTPLTPVSYEDKIRSKVVTTATNPTMYYLTNTHLGLVNIPTAASNVLYPTLVCRYYKKNTTLALTDNMPYNNLFNSPLCLFMDHIAVLKTTDPTEEYTALYNTLEESTLSIASKRIPV